MNDPLISLALVTVLTSLLDILEWLARLPAEIYHGYSSFLRWIADSVHSLYENYGYFVIFFGTLSENVLFLGFIVPGAIVVILAGMAAHDGTISVPVAIALGISGTVLGDTISYYMGRYGWNRFGRSRTLNELEQRVRAPLIKHGRLFVLCYHFTGYTRVVGPASAGLFKMPYRRWAPFDYTGATLWISTYVGIGYGLGALGLSLQDTDSWFRYFEWGLLAVAMVWLYIIFRKTGLLQAILEPSDDDEDEDDEEDNEALGQQPAATGSEPAEPGHHGRP